MKSPIESVKAYREIYRLNRGRRFDPEAIARAGPLGEFIISSFMLDMKDGAITRAADLLERPAAPVFGSYVSLDFTNGSHHPNGLVINGGLRLLSQIKRGQEHKGQVRIGYQIANEKTTECEAKLTYVNRGDLTDATVDIGVKAPISELRRIVVDDYAAAVNDPASFNLRKIQEAVVATGRGAEVGLEAVG